MKDSKREFGGWIVTKIDFANFTSIEIRLRYLFSR